MELSRQKLNLYWPLIPAGGLLLFCGWLLIGSSGQLPFTVKLLERECRRLETLRKNILDLREQNRQLRLETHDRNPGGGACCGRRHRRRQAA